MHLFLKVIVASFFRNTQSLAWVQAMLIMVLGQVYTFKNMTLVGERGLDH